MWIWGAAGAAAVLVYGLAIERMRFAPPLVMLALGGMTLAFTAGALWRVIDPLARLEPPGTGTAAAQGRSYIREIEREKQLVLKAIKEIELDYQMRKISDRDYREMIERELKDRLAVDKNAPAPRNAPAPSTKDAPTFAADTMDATAPAKAVAAPNACSGCGTTNDDDAQFCKKCGLKLAA